MVIFEMSHSAKEKSLIKQIDFATATELIDKFKNELNTVFMTELGEIGLTENYTSDGATEDETEAGPYCDTTFVFVGGSHAARLAAAAVNSGLDVVNLSLPGFRVTKTAVDDLVPRIQDCVRKATKRTVIIYHIYDNSVFFSAQDDGSRALPMPSPTDGRYHVPGDLVILYHPIVKNLVNNSIPLFRAGGDCEKIILSPLPRYPKECCSNVEHLTNLRSDTARYFITMGEAVSSMKDSIRDLIYGKKIRSFKVLNPLPLLLDGGEASTAEKMKKLWDTDPVHLVQDEYPHLLQGILDIADEGTLTRPSRDPVPGSAVNPRLFKRKSWVDSDDNLAHRNYGVDWRRDSHSRLGHKIRGRGNGGGRGRGPRGHFRGSNRARGHRSWPY
jgi:hypothetical protein